MGLCNGNIWKFASPSSLKTTALRRSSMTSHLLPEKSNSTDTSPKLANSVVGGEETAETTLAMAWSASFDTRRASII